LRTLLQMSWKSLILILLFTAVAIGEYGNKREPECDLACTHELIAGEKLDSVRACCSRIDLSGGECIRELVPPTKGFAFAAYMDLAYCFKD
ncbi:hypothetical protein PMAYCL1PPCAC_05094, partial [Pristionchus mayeri]